MASFLEEDGVIALRGEHGGGGVADGAAVREGERVAVGV